MSIDVAEWLKGLGLVRYEPRFAKIAQFELRMTTYGAQLPPPITGLVVEAQIRLLRSNPLRLGMQPSLTLYWL